MLFKIALLIDFHPDLGSTDEQRIEEPVRLVLNTFRPLSEVFQSICDHSQYHFHPTEIHEMRGVYQHGVSVCIKRNVDSPQHYHYLASIFQSAGLLVEMNDLVEKVSFEFD